MIQKNISKDFLSCQIFTYSLDGLFVQSDFDVEVFEVVVGRCLLIRIAGLLMHGLPPCTIHLIVLLGILALGPACAHHLLLLHHLHALHLLRGLGIVLRLHSGLLLPVLLGLHLLPLLSGHLLLLLVLLTTVLVVVLLLAAGGVVGLARGSRRICSHSLVLCLKFTFNLKY